MTGFHAHDQPTRLHIADDWYYEGGEITDLHWWGYYDDTSGPLGGFEISVYSDQMGAPNWGMGPLWGVTVPMGHGPGEVREIPYDTNNSNGALVYYYEIELNIPIPPGPSPVYWLDLMALSGSDISHVVWHWQSSYTSNLSQPWQWDDQGYQGRLSHDMAFSITDNPFPELEFGDAPEAAIAYPPAQVGAFPTCKTVGPAGWIQHNNFGAHFGPAFEFEPDGDAGLCPPPGCFPTYDDDECFNDGDAGLLVPESYTIDPSLNVVPCPNVNGTSLGKICQTAVWGTDVDIDVHNHMPNQTIGYVNVLMDWNQDGKWGGSSTCPSGAAAPEHVLVNYPVPNPYDGLLSAISPPPGNFLIGPNPGYVWTRFTITERPVPLPWTGEGNFEDGETEDYLLRIDSGQQIEHKMHYPQWPDPNGWDVLATEPKILADDFLCTETGLITNVIFWASWRDDDIGNVEKIHLSFHDDDRSGSFSKPGNPLWEWDTNNFTFEEVEPPSQQGWYDPNTTQWQHPNHEHYFRFEVPIPDDIAFVQEEGNIYWLDLQFTTTDGFLGWKTSLDHFEDDAVWGDTPNPGWQELIDPINGESLDLAFVIQGTAAELDFGDAPDPSYPTYLANNGARHVIVPGFHLGNAATSLDAETNGQPDATATGDDNDGNDDEDGITFATTPLIPGQQAIIDIRTGSSVINPASGFLDGWIDFNGNGNWTDPGEQIFTSYPLSILGFNTVFVPIPATATPNINTFARFRYSRTGGLGVTGLAPDGEVEDYEVWIGEDLFIKWVQWPDPTLPGLHAHDFVQGGPMSLTLADDWQCQGGLVTDLHWWGNYELDPTGQEVRGAGISHFHLSIHEPDSNNPCLPGAEVYGEDVPFAALAETDTGLVNNEGGAIYLYEYDLPEPFAQIPGNNYWLDLSAYANVPANPPHWRWQEAGRSATPILCGAVDRLDPVPGQWQTITWAGPQYSDMAFIITSEPGEPEFDFGDAPDSPYPTLVASNGARHQIRPGFYLGNNIDAEQDGQPDPNALGDDQNLIFPGTPYPPGDEDGVVFTTALFPGYTACVDVTLTSTIVSGGGLDAWIDFNGNGIWGDMAVEQIFVNTPLSPGLNSGSQLCFSVPGGANIGPTFARFRLSINGGLPPEGFAPDGEVEDYKLFIDGTKWEQSPGFKDQSPYLQCFWGWDELTVYDADQYPIVADDWPCQDDRPITDIHWWGSYNAWEEGEPPQNGPDKFHIGIWTDVPANVDRPWSHPGEMIWEYSVLREDTQEQLAGCDFHPDFMQSPDRCFRYDLQLPRENWFFQRPDENAIYWISIAAIYDNQPDTHVWGWKTREHMFMDDAVRISDPMTPVPGTQFMAGSPIIDLAGNSWDMAFVLTTSPGPPEPPNVDIDIVNTVDVELSWPHVTHDIYGNPVSVVKYYVYRDTLPYQGAAATLVDTVNGPLAPGLVTWPDPGKIGDPLTNYYYYVRAVTQDMNSNDVLSALSNHLGEFDFGIVPGSP